MKKIITLIFILTAFAGYSQETINYIWKRQPVKFSKIAHADTIFLSSESPYGAYGTIFSIDSTADGRYFINDGYAVNDSLTQIRSELADSVVLLRSDIGDTATALRAETLSSISDSTIFEFSTDHIKVKQSAQDSLFIGSTGGVIRAESTTLQVGGQFNQTPTAFSIASADYNAKNGNVVFVSGSGNLESIINCAVGTILTFYVTAGSAIQIDPADFTANAQTIRTLSGSIINLSDYDVITIICNDFNEFAVISNSGDNQ